WARASTSAPSTTSSSRTGASRSASCGRRWSAGSRRGSGTERDPGAGGGRMLEAVSPVTGERIAIYPTISGEEVQRAIEAAHEAFGEWRLLPVERRVEPLRRAAALLRERREEYAALVTREMGKVIREARVEIDKCALACEHVADHAAAYLAPEPVATEASRSYVAYEPLGVLLA